MRELPAGPVLAGMRADRMLAKLAKLPAAEFEALYAEAGTIMLPHLYVPLVLGRGGADAALRHASLVTLAPVMFALDVGAGAVAEDLARAIAAERGGVPLQGLLGGAPGGGGRDRWGEGTSGRKLWTPESVRPGEVSGLEEHGVPVQEGVQHSPVGPVPSGGGLPLEERLAQVNAEQGWVSTEAGVLAPLAGVLDPEAVPVLRRLAGEGLPPGVFAPAHSSGPFGDGAGPRVGQGNRPRSPGPESGSGEDRAAKRARPTPPPPDPVVGMLRDALRGRTAGSAADRLAEVLGTLIDGRRLLPGTHLPAHRTLAKELQDPDITENIVRGAYQRLVD